MPELKSLVVIDPEKVKRFNRPETYAFEAIAEELGPTVEQLGTVARRMVLDVVTQRQLLEFVGQVPVNQEGDDDARIR